jgi:hypothetical protein
LQVAAIRPRARQPASPEPVPAPQTGAGRHGSFATAFERHPVLAINIVITTIVAGMSLLVMVLPFAEPMNVLLSAGLVAAVAIGTSRARRAKARVYAPSAVKPAAR